MKINSVSTEDGEICLTLGCSVKHARQRYSTYLEEQKKNKVQNVRSLKEWQVQEEITVVSKKKAMLENTIWELTNDANKYAMDTENVSKIDDLKVLLSKSNSFWKTTKEKNEELNQCQSILKELFKKKYDLVWCPCVVNHI